MFTNYFSEIISQPADLCIHNCIGKSRQGRDIEGFSFGSGEIHISLIGGNHADEPVGPYLLRKLVNLLTKLQPDDQLLTRFRWFIIPHSNPDGEAANAQWWEPEQNVVNPLNYLCHVVRELPGDDMEFGFPHNDTDSGLRVENKAIYDWWRSFDCSFDLHVSLHGMGCAAGPWYLVEQAWQDRIDQLKQSCLSFVQQRGYRVHDIERNGEKGFFRLGKGFCTRPDSVNMKKYFTECGDQTTAEKFYPSSMETMRRISDDCLTLVSEMPLFILPDVAVELGPPDPAAVRWKQQIDSWRQRLSSNNESVLKSLDQEIRESGLQPMPISDQMLFQWHFICSGINQIIHNRDS